MTTQKTIYLRMTVRHINGNNAGYVRTHFFQVENEIKAKQALENFPKGEVFKFDLNSDDEVVVLAHDYINE